MFIVVAVVVMVDVTDVIVMDFFFVIHVVFGYCCYGDSVR